MHREPGLVGIDHPAVKARSDGVDAPEDRIVASALTNPWSIIVRAWRRPPARGPWLAVVGTTVLCAIPSTLAAMLLALPAVDVVCARAEAAVRARTWMELVIVMHGVLLATALLVTTRVVRAVCAGQLERLCLALGLARPPRTATPLLPTLLGLLLALPLSLLPVLPLRGVGNAVWPFVVLIVTARGLGALAGSRRPIVVDVMLVALALVPVANLCLVPIAVVMGAARGTVTLRGEDNPGNLVS